MVGYFENHTNDMYKLHNPETKRVIMSRGIKWSEWKIPIQRNHKDFCDLNEKELVSGIEEGVEQDTTPKSDPEYPLPVDVIPNEEESTRTNKDTKSPEPMWLNKLTVTDTSEYERAQRALKKLDTVYNTTMTKLHSPIIKGK